MSQIGKAFHRRGAKNAEEAQRETPNLCAASANLCASAVEKGFGSFISRRLLKFARLGTVLVVSVLGLAAQTEKLPGPEQPIPFSHKLHVGGQGLKCATCHKNPDPGERMGLATAAMCMQCHEEEKAESPSIQKLAGFAKDKREIKWRRVYEIPSYVFFSHRAHLESGATCITCHGEVKELEQMYKVKEINMASCMNCHQANKASTDCTYCHEKMN
ncbi:MAG: cytochrome c3 family protein [Blastocatellia bacterium]